MRSICQKSDAIKIMFRVKIFQFDYKIINAKSNTIFDIQRNY